ncbi:hypothetical protein N0V93_008356 [Gnomoniopsis smithogilvyi]|uniref:Uncharacterized protein n=1 Tax=Gnomoniopsis smithogilvyi TaxID=1191159 RepID=A0A9W8YLJ8_9PEZI|nr:hypothetical protein N0V93_008356 [Gnomoniopsis smithogilvyi]
MQKSASGDSREHGNARTLIKKGSSRCEILTWAEKKAKYELKTLATSTALQEELEKAIAANSASKSTASDGSTSAGVSELHQKPVVILHGLRHDFIRVLLGKTLGIAPSFLEAHAGRRGYWPHSRRGTGAGHESSFTNLIYPELVEAGSSFHQSLASILKFGDGQLEGHSTTSDMDEVDLLDGPILKSLSEGLESIDELGVALCRLSFWVGDLVDVIFLERQVWEDDRVSFKKAKMTKHSVTKQPAFKVNREIGRMEKPWEVILQEGNEAPSLRELIGETLDFETCTDRAIPLGQVLKELLHEHWLRLFDVLVMDETWSATCLASLQKHAESNELLVGETFRRTPITTSDLEFGTVGVGNWKAIAKTLMRMFCMTATAIETTRGGDSSINGGFSSESDVDDESSVSQSSAIKMKLFDADAAVASAGRRSEQALDRVTYIGAILLPVSIVSGMLSMSESFQPGARLFWVFWAISIPLIAVTVLVILVDKERVTEVWASIPSMESQTAGDGASVVLLGKGSVHPSLKEGQDYPLTVDGNPQPRRQWRQQRNL